MSVKKKSYLLNVKGLRQFLIVLDDIMHFLVAVILMTCAGLILIQTIPNLLHPEIKILLHVVNDVLLVLIIMELMWPIMRFLKREPFTLNPFLYIGIISSIRRVLMLEAEHSILAQTSGTVLNGQVSGRFWLKWGRMSLSFFPGHIVTGTLRP